MSVIKVENISCHFGSVKAVNELSFEIPEGSIFGLLGPNGAAERISLLPFVIAWPGHSEPVFAILCFFLRRHCCPRRILVI